MRSQLTRAGGRGHTDADDDPCAPTDRSSGYGEMTSRLTLYAACVADGPGAGATLSHQRVASDRPASHFCLCRNGSATGGLWSAISTEALPLTAVAVGRAILVQSAPSWRWPSAVVPVRTPGRCPRLPSAAARDTGRDGPRPGSGARVGSAHLLARRLSVWQPRSQLGLPARSATSSRHMPAARADRHVSVTCRSNDSALWPATGRSAWPFRASDPRPKTPRGYVRETLVHIGRVDPDRMKAEIVERLDGLLRWHRLNARRSSSLTRMP